MSWAALRDRFAEGREPIYDKRAGATRCRYYKLRELQGIYGWTRGEHSVACSSSSLELRALHTSCGHARDVHVHYASCQYVLYVILIQSNSQI